ncbi:hypothetical protein CO704_14330 [Cedecea neteri]|uniref:Uncharacterized protein n=1 Tax=Cedecea neteri TaxID=158822 RepID=A0A291DZR5_9ENTR|nr:hypothetical protein CO704_14330 [Cedecea neteri]
MNFPLIFSIQLAIIFFLIIVLLLEKMIHRSKKNMFLHKIKKLIIMPGVIVFVFSILTIITYKIR